MIASRAAWQGSGSLGDTCRPMILGGVWQGHSASGPDSEDRARPDSELQESYPGTWGHDGSRFDGIMIPDNR
eukprot:1995714-Rhodomonas_salina.2